MRQTSIAGYTRDIAFHVWSTNAANKEGHYIAHVDRHFGAPLP